jgi:beta-lactamase class A
MSRARHIVHAACGMLVVLALISLAPPVQAQPITPQAALVRVLTAPQEQTAWFAPAFLARVSVPQVQALVQSVKAQLGPYQSVTPQADGSYLVGFQRGTIRARIHLDGQGRIDGLLFSNLQFISVSRSAALQGLQRLPGQVSLLVLANGTPLLSVAPSVAPGRLLAVGSAFKLAVLAALQQRINTGQLSWTQQVTLRAQDKSLPSGVLQTRPDGSRYTVADLARYMIAISDNTAADLLIHLVGRAAIAPFIPERDRPILTTRELFVLKDPANKGLRERYLAAARPAARLAILAQVDQLPLPSLRVLVPLLVKGPVAPRIEWFFSVRQLCGLMARVQRLPQMSINPGVANPAEWTHVAFKGGSESGVINLTTMATAHNGVTYCVSATWNNTALLDAGRFEALYSSVLQSLPH